MLDVMWQRVLADEGIVAPPELVALVESPQVAIRFCLPTQLLGKLAAPEVDTLCSQRGTGAAGQWDPRGFAAAVIVPWNRENQSVLGKSGDPYVSNPLRRPRLDAGLEQRDGREEWDRLCLLLGEIEAANDATRTETVLLGTLAAIRNRLRSLSFTYVVPARVSASQAERLVHAFLGEPSGGDRGLAIAAALFESLKGRVPGFAEVRRGMINAADAATGAAGDIECLDETGRIRLAVEVKEERLSLASAQHAVEKARTAGVTELLLCSLDPRPAEAAEVEALFARSWASGTNPYRVGLPELLHGLLPILGESGTRDFVVQVGRQLDAFSTQPRHRKAWKSLLDAL